MLRILKPDLLCGLGGFALGAVAILWANSGAMSQPAAPSAQTDVLRETAAAPVAHPPLRTS